MNKNFFLDFECNEKYFNFTMCSFVLSESTFQLVKMIRFVRVTAVYKPNYHTLYIF